MALRDHLVYATPSQAPCDEYGSCAEHFRHDPSVTECGAERVRGATTQRTIAIDIQPDTGDAAAEQLMLMKGGHDAKVRYKFFYNPRHPTNVAANGGDPLFLVSSDSKFVTEGFDAKTVDHADIVQWMGEDFLVCGVSNWGGETCLGTNCNIIDHQEGWLERFVDQNNSRLATVDNDTFQITEPLLP